MARRTGPRDWQERAFEASQIERETRENAEFTDVPNPMRDSVDLPRKSRWRWSLVAVAILIIAVVVRGTVTSNAPSLTTNCSVAGFALSSQQVTTGSTLGWAATGPSGTRFIIAIGVSRLTPQAKSGVLRSVPDPGVARQNTAVPVLDKTLPTSCKSHGVIGVAIAPGVYNIRLFTLAGSGANVTATVAATKRLTINQ